MSGLRHVFAVDEAALNAFAAATGDFSSIHMKAEFARRSRYRRRVAHGLLPVTVLLLAAGDAAAKRLQALRCRFLQPAFIGDDLELEIAAPGTDGQRQVFTIKRAGGTVVTEGFASFFDDGAVLPAAPAKAARAPSFEEAASQIQDLAAGAEESIEFHSAVSALQGLRNCVPFIARPGHAADIYVQAAAMASTLVGMRLPGRHATFTEFEAAFTVPLPPDRDVKLVGTIEKILAGSSRLTIAARWLLDGHDVARGSLSAIVNAPSPGVPTAEDIRRDHLASGIAGRVALVTGASRGIGEATAKLLALHGAKVAVHYFAGAADAEAIVKDVRAQGGTAIAIGGDLTDQASIERIFAAVTQALGPVEILVNNAVGEFSPHALETLDSADFLRELNLSLFGMHACCKLALPSMKARRWGKIVNLGTVTTMTPVGGQSVYTTAKSAVVGYTRSLAAEVAGDNIQVNLVVPGMVETSLIAGVPRGLKGKIAAESPQGRLLQPIEIAKAIFLLVSDWASAISGQQLVVNRGEPPFL